MAHEAVKPFLKRVARQLQLAVPRPQKRVESAQPTAVLCRPQLQLDEVLLWEPALETETDRQSTRPMALPLAIPTRHRSLRLLRLQHRLHERRLDPRLRVDDPVELLEQKVEL